MTSAALLEWRWKTRATALPAQAAVAWGNAAQQLLARLHRLSLAEQAMLSATASRDVVVVTGEISALPWVDGVAYAAPCIEAPGLWLPTWTEPDLPGDLLARMLQRQHHRQPLLLWPQPQAVIPLDRLTPVSAVLLARIDALWRSAR